MNEPETIDLEEYINGKDSSGGRVQKRQDRNALGKGREDAGKADRQAKKVRNNHKRPRGRGVKTIDMFDQPVFDDDGWPQ